MADVFRPSYQQQIPSDAKLFTKKGTKMARFKQRNGRTVEGPIMPNGNVRIMSDNYYAHVKIGAKRVRVPLHTSDLEAARQLRAKMQLHHDHKRAGMIDPYAEHRIKPLLAHLEDYETHLKSAARDPRYIKETVAMVKRTIKVCGFKTIEDIDATVMNKHLAGLISRGKSYHTRNRVLKSLLGLIHWMQKNDRTDKDPLRTIALLDEGTDPNRRVRRALTLAELGLLVQAAESGPMRDGLDGPERALLYAFGALTGLRRSEIAKLRIRDVSLECEVPIVEVSAIIAKANRDDVIPLHPVVANKLRTWLLTRDAAPSAPLFHLYSDNGQVRRTSRMMKEDCAAAGIEHVTADGIADFHSHRVSYVTALCRSTDLPTASKLARHRTVQMTAKTYDRVNMGGKVAAILALPAPKL